MLQGASTMSAIMQSDIIQTFANGSHGSDTKNVDIDEATDVNSVQEVRDCTIRKRDRIE